MFHDVEEVEVFDANVVAERVMTDYLINAFHDADIVDIMNNDPDCALLLDSDWEAVRQAMYRQRQVFVRVV